VPSSYEGGGVKRRNIDVAPDPSVSVRR